MAANKKHCCIFEDKKTIIMPLNKNAMERYLLLDKYFRTNCLTVKELIKEVSDTIGIPISRRQIYMDIEYMKIHWDVVSENLTKERDRKSIRYKYRDDTISILNQMLTETDVKQLGEAIQFLNRFKGLPQFEWMEEMSTRLNTTLHLQGSGDPVVAFDRNLDSKGLEHFETIFNAITKKQVLSVRYKPYHEDEVTHTIHPYFLKQYNNRWFLFGWNEDAGKVYNPALDRIVSLSPHGAKYMDNENVDFNEYFDDIIGVTRYDDKEPQKILLRIDKATYPYIETKPLHPYQKYLKDRKVQGSNYDYVELNIIPNFEFYALILSYGEAITILEPENIREKMKEKVNKIANNYQSSTYNL